MAKKGKAVQKSKRKKASIKRGKKFSKAAKSKKTKPIARKKKGSASKAAVKKAKSRATKRKPSPKPNSNKHKTEGKGKKAVQSAAKANRPIRTTQSPHSIGRAGAVSSPASTGGAGTVFEQHVDAFLLALLMVRGIPPVLTECGVTEVHLQTEHLGYHTDDFLVIAETGEKVQRRLLGQVKRTFTLSSADEECVKTIEDYWKDLANPSKFDAERDRFALVTLRGTSVLLEHFAGLLHCARAAQTAADFKRRLETPGFLSQKAIHYCEEIRKIISQLEGRDVTTVEVWPLLRLMNLLSFDLTSTTAQTEALVKTLLAHTSTSPNSIAAADATWSALLREVGEGAPQAKSYRRADLPAGVRDSHSPLSNSDELVLRTLQEHSGFIVDSIRTEIGDDAHLARARLVQEILNSTENSQVTLVSGAAGSGKSVLAKVALSTLGGDTFTFCFRAEEFAESHLDVTLHVSARTNATGLGAVLAGQSSKVLLIESVERLLESSKRSAFADLLVLLRKDPSWRLILTCRDYSTDLVRTALLESAGMGHAIVRVPDLSDAELDEVLTKCPKLATPLTSTILRPLLRRPYLLDKAAGMEWPTDRPLPTSEREFRAKFWREVIRADDRLGDGMPRRREETFVAIALGRARAMSLYVPRGQLDAAVLESLHHDSLIAFSESSDALVAPAHDVLEDWAILQWIGEQFELAGRSLASLAPILGTYPAIRRTYRKWLQEIIELDPQTADSIFTAVANDPSLPRQFSDDTLVSLLRSRDAVTLLARNSTLLLTGDKRLLHRIIHLLRVACVRTPDWAAGSPEAASQYQVPDGEVWSAVLSLISDNLSGFSPHEQPLLLGLIYDWSRGVNWQTPYPAGATAAAAIAHRLLSNYRTYSYKEQRHQALQVIAKIPNADPARFLALFEGDLNDDGLRSTIREFQELIIEQFDGAPACRDQAEAVVRVARRRFLLQDDEMREHGHGYSSLVEPLFGIRESTHFDFFPASAIRSIFLNLLRSNPNIGVDFLIEICDHSAEWFAHPRVRRDYVESPVEITVILPDGTERRQWCNPRLWNLYRGTSVGPSLLQTALMALEQFLFELAEAFPITLDPFLLRLLGRTSSGAVTAVLASVATAFPHQSSETLLTLLSSRDCIQLDRFRLAHESQVPSRLADVIPSLPGKRIYDRERKQSDALPHRRLDLETAIMNLQLGPHRERVQAVLDRHRTALAPEDEQDEDDQIWRLALHRMDVRQYEITDELTEDVPQGNEPAERHLVKLELNLAEPDLREMVEQSAAESAAMNDRLGLINWGMSMFAPERHQQHDPGIWRARLGQAMQAAPLGAPAETIPIGEGGPGYVAAVCVRDHWDEMNSTERDWCVNRACSEVEYTADHWNDLARMQKYRMAADRPCAYVMPILIGKVLPDESRQRVVSCLIEGITHPVDEVRQYAVTGVARHLWRNDRELALRCVNAIATMAHKVQTAFNEERRVEHESRRSLDSLEAEQANIIRRQFFDDGVVDPASLQTLDINEWVGADANVLLLTILSGVPNDPLTVQAFLRFTTALVTWWDAAEDHSSDDRQQRSTHAESQLTELLGNVLLEMSEDAAAAVVQPLLAAVGRHTRELSYIVISLAVAEDRKRKTTAFWRLWNLFASAAKGAEWLRLIDRDHARGSDLLAALFLSDDWKEGVRHWDSLDGHVQHIHSLFEELPLSAAVLEHYLRFHYFVGERSLPQAFIGIATRLKEGDASILLGRPNSVYYLETLLRRHVYSRPLELKQDARLRAAVIELLDALVEQGSSGAYRMRDDFVTPASAV